MIRAGLPHHRKPWLLVAVAIVAATPGCRTDGSSARTADSAGTTSAEPPAATAPPATTASPTTAPPATTASPTTAPEPAPPAFPDGQSGAFGVGHTTLTIGATTDGPALTADVWYPSDDSTAPPTRYELLPGIGAASPVAREDGAPAAGSYPLMIYSHGSGGFRFVATDFTETMASHGFVVAAVDHPGDTVIDAFVQGGQPDIAGATLRRVDEIARLIEGVTERSAAGDASFAGAVDPARVVVTGHSLGGAGVLDFAALRPEVDAVIAMDPTLSLVANEDLQAITAPVLTIVGESFDPADTSQTSLLDVPWYQVHMPTASHLQFTDVCRYADYLAEWTDAGAPAVLTDYVQGLLLANCGPEQIDPGRAHTLIDGYSLAFLHLALDGDPAWADTLATIQPDAVLYVGS